MKSKKEVDNGKARPSAGPSQRYEKWGFIPAAAGKNPKKHPMTDISKMDGMNVTDRGKNGRHGHNYPGRPLPSKG
jgi:hypothetical protein